MIATTIVELDKTLETSKVEELIGFLATHTIVDIKKLTALLEISDQNRIRSLLEALIEKEILQGYFEQKNKIRLVSGLEIPPNPKLSEVPPESHPLLGALVGFEEFRVSTFAELFRLKKKTVIQEICRLVSKGSISGVFEEKDKFRLEHAPHPDPRPIFDQTPLVRMLIGACIVHKQITLLDLAKLLGESDVKTLLKELLIAFAQQTLKGRLTAKGKNVLVDLDNIGYEQVPLPLAKLMGKYLTTAGALIVYQRASLRELAKTINLSARELRQTIYTLAADGTLDPVIAKETVWLNTMPPITCDISFDQLTNQERLVLGMTLGHKKCSLRSIAKWLSVETNTVRQIFFKLILNNILQGTITLGPKEEFHQADSSSSALEPTSLETDDFVTLGALISNSKPAIPTLAAQLGRSSPEFERALFLLLAKRAIEGEVRGRKFLLSEVLIDQPSPPSSELDSNEAVVTLGYLLARIEVRFRDMAKDFGWDLKKVAQNIYYLAGLGTIRGQVDGKDKFRLQDAVQTTPTRTPVELGAAYAELLSMIRPQSDDLYLLKELARSLRISENSVRVRLCHLIGEGLLQGVLDSKKFTPTADATSSRPFERQMICAQCGMTYTGSVCPQCGKEVFRCPVCSKPLNINEPALLSCPHCNALGHEAHLKEWVKIRGTCPNCKVRLTMELLEPVSSGSSDTSAEDDTMLELP